MGKMKQYTTLDEAKRSLAAQILFLTVAALLFSLTGRILAHNRFPLSLVLTRNLNQIKTAGNVTIKWEEEGVAVTDYELGQVFEETAGNTDNSPAQNPDGVVDARILKMTMLPKKAGKYVLKVLDPNGMVVLKDEIFVDRFRTAFSKETGSFTGDEAFILSGILYYFGLTLIMLIFFRRLKGPLAYSYEAILSCGVFIFSLVALIILIPVYISHLTNPEFYPTWQFFCDIAAGGKYFTIFTAPFIIIFSILLIISNIELLRHENTRFQNILGLLLGIILITGEIVYYIIYTGLRQAPLNQQFLAISIENIIGIIFTYFECILFASLICGLRAAKHVPAYDRDYILILGCGFRKDGTLPPLLRGRVDKALEFWHKQKEETGKEAVIIPSGGQGKGEPMAEARAMYRYMAGIGFPESAVILEDNSANTYQNMEFSKKIIDCLNPDDNSSINTAYVTTNYHVFRSGVWAGLAGLKAEGIGSRTRWWFWPNAFIRECAGLFRNRLIPEIGGLIVLVAFFAIITRLAYL